MKLEWEYMGLLELFRDGVGYVGYAGCVGNVSGAGLSESRYVVGFGVVEGPVRRLCSLQI